MFHLRYSDWPALVVMFSWLTYLPHGLSPLSTFYSLFILPLVSLPSHLHPSYSPHRQISYFLFFFRRKIIQCLTWIIEFVFLIKIKHSKLYSGGKNFYLYPVHRPISECSVSAGCSWGTRWRFEDTVGDWKMWHGLCCVTFNEQEPRWVPQCPFPSFFFTLRLPR